LEALSFDGLVESLARRRDFETRRQHGGKENIRILGIVPTMFRASTLVHQENFAKLRAAYGEIVWAPIAMRTVWVEASTVGMLVYPFAPDSDAAMECFSMVNRVVQGMGL
jgi:cellulose biosynthesis protein BcsQ